MYIRSLAIRSLRCFESAELSLQYPDRDRHTDLLAPNVNLLLGNNGSGKSTVLAGLALAALAPVLSKSAGYVPYHMVRKGANHAEVNAEVELHGQDVSDRT